MDFFHPLFLLKKGVTKKNFFFRDPFLKKLFVENNSYIFPISKLQFLLRKSGHEKKKFRDPFLKKSLVENNSYIYV